MANEVSLDSKAQPAAQPSAGVTTDFAAQAFGYHVESVRRAIRQGRIRTVPFGRTYRIPLDEFARILREGLPA